ncbi:MAG: adenylate kinase family protein [Candidatus Woesearchaeota archaeon]
MFIRSKKIKNNLYAYAIKNKWTKLGPRQCYSKYLGKVIVLKQENNLDFEEIFNYKINKNDPYYLVRYIIIKELTNYGFKKKNEFKYYYDDIVINLINGTIKKNKKNIVLMLNNDFLSTFTLKKLIFFNSTKDKNNVALDLAKSFIQAGIAVRQDLFIQLFNLIYRNGQTFIEKKKIIKKNKKKLSSNKIEKNDKNTKLLDKKVIIVSGTPGTGKTTLSEILAKKINAKYVDVNTIIKNNKLNNEYDDEKKCYIIDEKKLVEKLKKMIKNSKNSLVIDSHLSHYLPKDVVGLCIITKCELKELEKRLKKRKYNKQKVRDNLDCEIFEVCKIEAIENNHNIIEVFTDKTIDYNQIINKIDKLNNKI